MLSAVFRRGVRTVFGPPDIKKLKAKGNVHALLVALNDPEWQIQRDAAKALSELVPPEAVPVLFEKLGESRLTPEVRKPVYSALVNIGAPTADALRPILKKNCATRSYTTAQREHNWRTGTASPHTTGILPEVLTMLGEIGDQASVPYLVKAVRPYYGKLAGYANDSTDPFDMSVERSAAAARALGNIGDPVAVVPLIAELEASPERHSKVINAIVVALGKLGDPRAVEPLEKVLAPNRYRGFPSIRRGATNALESIRAQHEKAE